MGLQTKTKSGRLLVQTMYGGIIHGPTGWKRWWML